MSAEPLAGLRVLDLTSVVVGPVCTLRLAQYGAEIIKVEAPAGDMMRSLGGGSPTGQHSGAYLHFNRRKRAVCLDLKVDGALGALSMLLARCDVFVSNMRPAALVRLGLDAETLRKQRPDLVHCAITGYGSGGRYRNRPAYDSVVQGASGVAGLSLKRDGKPRYAPVLMCDHVTGEIAAGAVLAALVNRARTGQGAVIEVPMFETMAAFVLQEHLAQRSFDPPVGPIGDLRTLDPGHNPVATADGWISFTANTNAQVQAFMRLAGQPELAEDPRFATVAARMRNLRDWYSVRDAAVKRKTTDEWLALMLEADIPAMPCHTLETLEQDPHLAEIGLIHTEAHPTEGAVKGLRSTILIDGAPAVNGAPAAPIGWQTRDILAEFGMSDVDIDVLIASGAARQHP